MAIQINHPKGVIKGEIRLTASKSISNRVLIIQSLYGLDFEIENLAKAEDTQILQQLLQSKESTLDVGLAGTTMRFLTAYLSLKEGEFTLTGANRMKQRPIKILVEALKQLGATIEYLEEVGYPPLNIKGGSIVGDKVEIKGSVSSQYISALLLIAPKLKNGLTIELKGEVISRPYIEMTIAIMQYFGAEVNWERNTIVVLPLDKAKFNSQKSFFVEADWSAASYWYGIAALAKEADITLYGLEKNSLQGDAIVQEIYKDFGVETTYVSGGIRLIKKNNFSINDSELKMDFITCPDIAQTVAVTCASLNIKAQFTGLKTLRIKETDRISALQTELNHLGYNVEVDGDELTILSSIAELDLFSLKKPIKTYNDHRMAMAFAPLGSVNAIQIEDENVVIKSYPKFWEDLQHVGFDILTVNV
jgi:3-phosphoshikimate 1-carboxyvinyltransferase